LKMGHCSVDIINFKILSNIFARTVGLLCALSKAFKSHAVACMNECGKKFPQYISVCPAPGADAR